MKEKIIISMPDLAVLIDLLILYGQARDHVEIENAGWGLKAFFIGEDEFLKKDLADWSEGQIQYRENEEVI